MGDAAPYAMSDMTGFVTLGSTFRSGSWIAVQDGGAPGKIWRRIAWNTIPPPPAGTGIMMEVRAADKLTDLPWNPQTQTARAFTAVQNDVQFNGVTGRYLEVRATLWRNPGIAQTPELEFVTVRPPQ